MLIIDHLVKKEKGEVEYFFFSIRSTGWLLFFSDWNLNKYSRICLFRRE